MKGNKFIDKVFTSDNQIEYLPNELVCLRYSLRYTKLLTYKDVFGNDKSENTK